MVYQHLSHGLGGRTLRVVTKQFIPFIVPHEDGNQTRFTGFCMDVLDLLAEALNFTYTIWEPDDGIWGRQLPNGTWAGLTGFLHRKEADLVVTGFSVTSERATVSDYTMGFFYDDIIMMTSYPDPTPVGWTFYVRPFHWYVYLLLGCCLLLLTVVLTFLERHAGFRNYVRVGGDQSAEEKEEKKKKKKKKKSLGSGIAVVLEALLGGLLGRAVAYEVGGSSGRVLLWSWCLVCMVTVSTYTGKLTSNSLVTQQPVPFNSLSELVRRSDYRWGVDGGTSTEEIFTNSSIADYQRYYQKVLEFAAEDPDVLWPESVEVTVANVLRGKYVHVTSAAFCLELQRQHCRLTSVKERLFQDTFAIHLQKDSPLTAPFNRVLSSLTEQGILEYLKRKWLPETEGCQDREARAVQVRLQLVETAFIMAAVGLSLAGLLLLLERLLRCTQCSS